MKRFPIAALVVSLSVTFPGAFQSDRGTVRGVVVDSAGGIVPGVEVTLSRLGGAERKTITNDKGAFTFTLVEPGRYAVTAALAGFSTARASVVVWPRDVTDLTLTLEIGSV